MNHNHEVEPITFFFLRKILKEEKKKQKTNPNQIRLRARKKEPQTFTKLKKIARRNRQKKKNCEKRKLWDKCTKCTKECGSQCRRNE